MTTENAKFALTISTRMQSTRHIQNQHAYSLNAHRSCAHAFQWKEEGSRIVAGGSAHHCIAPVMKYTLAKKPDKNSHKEEHSRHRKLRIPPT